VTAPWVVLDGWTVTRRHLTQWARQPEAVVFGLAFPILITLLFGYVFGGAITVPGGGSYRQYLMPGMFAMTMVFGVAATAAAVAADVTSGITERFRALPMAAPAAVAGRAAADLLYSVLGLAVMLGCALLVGWRPHGSAGGTVAAVGLLVLLRFGLLWVGVYLGLAMRGTGAVTAVQTLEFPIGFLANTFVSPDTMPGWLGAVAGWNPLSATVSATRALFGDPAPAGTGWAAAHALPLAVLWPVLLTAVFLPLAARAWRRLDR
jgi:ABC-type multidrug transport system permease subunit